MNKINEGTTSTADREIVLTRSFDAPRSLVWKAWTDPKQIAQWWGPHGFTNPLCEWDARPGGSILVHMRGPKGSPFDMVLPMKGIFHEVIAPERLVFTSSALEDEAGHAQLEVRNTVTFAEHNGKTTLTLHAQVIKAAPAAAGAIAGMEQGWTQSLERLAAILARTSTDGSANREFIISREFDVPRELMFKVWTDPEHMQRWWGPKDFTVVHSKMDLRPGGVYHYCIRSPDGHDMWGKFVYREIVKSERIVFVNSFSDENGGVTRHPMSSTWPLEMLSTITFTEQAGKTTVTVRWLPLNATEEERNTFEAGLDSMHNGWTGTLDQLAAYLAKD